MKPHIPLRYNFTFIILFVLFATCQEEDPINLPLLLTINVSDIRSTTAISGGFITDDGGAQVEARGVCWGISSGPTIDLTTKTIDSNGVGSYTSQLSGLTPGTKYYVRSYATNRVGTTYGNEYSFITLASLPIVSTTVITAITSSSATGGGIVSSENGANVTARGICWSTSPEPTINLSTKTIDGNGTGSYTSQISNLVPGTTYHVRSYATNSTGTAYGDEFEFKALALLPMLTTTGVTSITSTGALGGGTVSNENGANVTVRGVCWGTSAQPTISLTTKTIDGNGIGNYTSQLSNLTPETTYYVRSYATNSVGTAYGSEVSFKTTASVGANMVIDFEGNQYAVNSIGTQTWMLDNLRSTKYADGSNIVGYYHPNGDISNTAIFGMLYTPSAAMHGSTAAGVQGACPNGYHVPKQDEVLTLFDYLSENPNVATGFSPVAAGQWYKGSYYLFQSLSSLLTSTSSGSAVIWYGYSASSATFFAADFTLQAQSLRCIKNN